MSASNLKSNYDRDEPDNFIDEQRRSVLEEATAQSEFLSILENLDPTSTIIDTQRGLDGDVDCSIIEKCNFKGITTLLFSPGKITSITGIPIGVKKIVCAKNYLIDTPELPDGIVDVDLQQNAIRSIGSLPEGIKEINISNNQIERLENLPASIEVLICDNNKLHILNLAGIENLRILKCSNNPRLVIENLPDTLVEFQMDNDVGTQIERIQDEKDENEPGADSKANYSECLYTYFELKKTYEDKVRTMKRSAYSSAKNKKAARIKIADLKPKCIGCARPVGTIFKNEGRTYIAKCGNESTPCVLDIRLFAGEYSSITDMVEYYQTLIEIIKQQIMIDKLDVLFQYMTEKDGVELFKENLDFYTEENIHLASLKKQYDNLYFGEERKDKIEIKMKKIQDIHERIGELLNKGDPDILADAMTIYIEELVPEMENLQLIKYDTRELLVNESSARLYQTPFRIQDLEYTFGEYPKVIKFRVK